MSDDMKTSFAEYIEAERNRLADELGHWLDVAHEAEIRKQAIHAEFAAIEAYEQAKLGKLTPATRASAVRRVSRGSRREAILSAVAAAPAGMSRKELIQALDIKNDKSGEQSISNALTALKKAGALVSEAGKYHCVATLAQAAE